MSLSFLHAENRAEIVGRTPGLRGSPWTHRSPNEWQADEGVGCGPGVRPTMEVAHALKRAVFALMRTRFSVHLI